MRFLLNAVAVNCIAPHAKESGFLPSYFFPLEFRIGENFSCGIKNPTTDWSPENYFHQQKHIQYMEPEPTAWDPESNNVLDSIHYVWQRHRTGSPNTKKKTLQRGNRRNKTKLFDKQPT